VNNRPRISFAIPTYNRCVYLLDLVESIVNSCREAGVEDYEICISDNNSPDDTEKKLLFLATKNPRIRYKKSQRDLGPQRNIAKAMSMAEGGYIWLLGDDDGLYEYSVAQVLNQILHFPDVDLFLLNRTLCDANLNYVADDNYLKSCVSRSVVLADTDDLLSYIEDCKTVDGLGCFISSWVVKKEVADEIYRDCDIFFDKNLFPHVYALWGYSLRKEAVTLRYIHDRLVKWRGDNSCAVRGLVGRAMHLDQGFVKNETPQRVYKAVNSLIRLHFQHPLTIRAMIAGGVKLDEAKYALRHFHDASWLMARLYAYQIRFNIHCLPYKGYSVPVNCRELIKQLPLGRCFIPFKIRKIIKSFLIRKLRSNKTSP